MTEFYDSSQLVRALRPAVLCDCDQVGTARFIRNMASRPGALYAGGGSSSSTPAGDAAGGSSSGVGGGSSAGGSSEPLLKPHVGPLLRALVAAVGGERSATVRRAYAAAAAQVRRVCLRTRDRGHADCAIYNA